MKLVMLALNEPYVSWYDFEFGGLVDIINDVENRSHIINQLKRFRSSLYSCITVGTTQQHLQNLLKLVDKFKAKQSLNNHYAELSNDLIKYVARFQTILKDLKGTTKILQSGSLKGNFLLVCFYHNSKEDWNELDRSIQFLEFHYREFSYRDDKNIQGRANKDGSLKYIINNDTKKKYYFDG